VCRHGHDRAGAVLYQHIVRDEHRDLLAVDGVRHRPPEWDARLLLVLRPALGRRLALGPRDVVADLLRVVQLQDVGMFWRHHEERRAEERVWPRREDRVVDAQLFAAEDDLGALRPADPVLLLGDDLRRPVDRLHVVEQPVGVLRDPEEPLLELPDLDHRSAALASAVRQHLLVRQHGGVLRAPVDRGLFAVGEPLFE
jgi:hypothetical protein